MTTKFKELMDGHTLSPTPTQSALLNSRTGGGSSPAKKQEEHGQWDKRTSSASKESLPVWTTIAGYVIYQRGNVHFLLFPSTKSKRDALDLTKGTRIIGKLTRRQKCQENGEAETDTEPLVASIDVLELSAEKLRAYQETDPTLVSARGTVESEKGDLASN
eukprot:Em0013g711a